MLIITSLALLVAFAMLLFMIIKKKDQSKVTDFLYSIKLPHFLRKDGMLKHFYFADKVEKNMVFDYFFYQLELRKNMPFFDWYYFEYIRLLARQNRIKKLIVFPTVDISATDHAEVENTFAELKKNIDKMFNNITTLNIEIIPPYKDDYSIKPTDWTSSDFIRVLEYIGHREYFEYLRNSLKIKISCISDFNKFRNDSMKVLYLFLNIYKAWSVVNYIKEKGILEYPSVKISAIFWKWQVDKVGVMRCFLNGNFFPLLSRTLPIHDYTVTADEEGICIFDDEAILIDKALRYKHSLKRCNKLIRDMLFEHGDILKWKDVENEGCRIWARVASEERYQKKPKIKRRFRKRFYRFLGLIKKTHSRYT